MQLFDKVIQDAFPENTVRIVGCLDEQALRQDFLIQGCQFVGMVSAPRRMFVWGTEELTQCLSSYQLLKVEGSTSSNITHSQ